MTSPKGQSVLPTTFASIRFAADHLDADAIPSFFLLKPTVSYSKGDPFSVGRSGIAQKREFGLWLFRTENIVSSNACEDHLNFIMSNFWHFRSSSEVKTFLNENSHDMIISLY